MINKFHSQAYSWGFNEAYFSEIKCKRKCNSKHIVIHFRLLFLHNEYVYHVQTSNQPFCLILRLGSPILRLALPKLGILLDS